MENESGGSAPEPGLILYIGHHETQQAGRLATDVLSEAQDLGYDFVTTPITTTAFYSRVFAQLKEYRQALSQQADANSVSLPTISSLTPADTTLEPQNSNSFRIGVASPWMDLGSLDPVIAHTSRQVLNIEVAYAAFCGINNVVVYGPNSTTQAVQFGRSILEALGLGPYVQVHILLPMTTDLELDHGDLEHLSEMVEDLDIHEDDELSDDEDLYGSWETWNTIRSVCNYHPRLSIALEVPRQLPSASLQSRWYSEPTRLLVFPRTSFLRNAKGYPVLSKSHQQLLSRFARLRFPPWVLLSDVGAIQSGYPGIDSARSPEPTPAEAASKPKEKPKDPVPHLRYFRHLQQSQPPLPPIERFGQGYQDYLQSPLQPLTDNLESITYEVFEKDPVKYEWYERAIAAALRDLAALIEDSRELVVAVVGAGRGPLVTRALQASETTGIPIQCWAVEKNPNAYVLLERKSATDPLWRDRVKVVKSDMRHWHGLHTSNTTERVDILVSELLGSFGDNELSPECLDGVQHVLHPEHGICIPQSYSAHFTPIASPRLHSDLLSRPGTEKWELPYVVMLHQYDYLCSEDGSDGRRIPEVKAAWNFSHPLPLAILERSRRRAGGQSDAGGWAGGDGGNEHNARFCKLAFTCNGPGVCHGLAGYFETVLYDGGSEKIELSTNPRTMDEKSKDMISWFPIFFPLKTPLHVAGSDVEVTMWRQTDDRSVWYEWFVEVFDKTKGGKKRLAMSDFHSSQKHACLV